MKLLLWLLKQKKLSQKNRGLILNYLLERVEALPVKDILTYNLDGTVQVAGKDLTPEQLILLREGAIALEKNWTYRTIKEQLAYEAIKMGVHSALTVDMVLMSKAILWIQENEIALIKKLNGN